jgi:hypothetical protein
MGKRDTVMVTALQKPKSTSSISPLARGPVAPGRRFMSLIRELLIWEKFSKSKN